MLRIFYWFLCMFDSLSELSMSELDNESFIEEMKYFKSIDFNVSENTYLINQMAEKLKCDFNLIVGYEKSLCISK